MDAVMTVVTSADTHFFPLARGLANTLPAGVSLWVYDLGLTPTDVAALRQDGVRVERIPVPADRFAMTSANHIRATHKMDCIQSHLRATGSGALVLDADVLLLDPAALAVLAPEPDEVVVTYRCARENKPYILVNGKINTGVMAFGRDVPSSFFQAWKDLCADPEHTDQSALSVLLEERGVDWTRLGEAQTLEALPGVRVRVLDGNLYNDTTCRTGALFHFKSAGRRGNKRFWYQIFVRLLRLAPGFVRGAVDFNRKHRLLVWKPKAGGSSGDA